MKTKIVWYHFGFVVEDADGVALSRAFADLDEAKKFQAQCADGAA